jgi:hypothetical protein
VQVPGDAFAAEGGKLKRTEEDAEEDESTG